MTLLDISHSEEIYSVSRLNREVRFILEGSFPLLWVEGEISNFAAPHSGHWYFSLKESTAQVRCAMFKLNNRKLDSLPKDGMHVLIKARVSLYEGRGEFQLLVEHLEEAGEGKLRQEFEALKKRLFEAGLFSESHKKTLPAFPKTIGVITSATGAAIRDILSVLARRFSYAAIIIYPTLVQGELAASQIVKAIQTANQRNECDALILARGGGSLEDLWPFNEEMVAKAIYQSELPIVSGVGHEIDFTIADFVADLRAPTPSSAAELLTPDQTEILATLLQKKMILNRLINQKLDVVRQQIVWMKKNLDQQHPKRRLLEKTQALDLFEAAFIRLQFKFFTAQKSTLQTLQAKLFGLTPEHKIHTLQHRVNHLTKILQNSMMQQLQRHQQSLGTLSAKLDALSPLSTLQRGFAIATRGADLHILKTAREVKPGDKINVRLQDGLLACLVEEVHR